MLIQTNETGLILSRIFPCPGTEEMYAGYYPAPDSREATHFRNGVLLTQPEKPSVDHVFDDALFEWVLDLSVAKDNAAGRINFARNKAERAGFEAFGKVFDADDKAIQRVSVAAQAASIALASGNSYSIEWTCADNSTIQLSAEQLVQLPLIMAQAANALHVKARTLKAQIAAATTIEEIESIVW